MSFASPDVARMLKLVVTHHDKQFDRGGVPYAMHPIHVAQQFAEDNDSELVCIALGHDLIEDTELSSDDLRIAGFSERVIAGIVALSKERNDEDEEATIARVLSNTDAIRVKIEDIRHNSCITRLKGVRQKDLDRMAKYHRMYLRLTAALK